MLVLAAVAWRQTSYWRDTETLWMHTVCLHLARIGWLTMNLAGVCLASDREESRRRSRNLREAVEAANSIAPDMTRQVPLISWQTVLNEPREDSTRRSRITKKQCVSTQPVALVSCSLRDCACSRPGSTIEPSSSGAKAVRLAPTDFGSTYRPGRRSAGRRRCW